MREIFHEELTDTSVYDGLNQAPGEIFKRLYQKTHTDTPPESQDYPIAIIRIKQSGACFYERWASETHFDSFLLSDADTYAWARVERFF